MENIIIGIDMGGTNLRIGAVNTKNILVQPLILKSECIANSSSPIYTLCKIIDEYPVSYTHLQDFPVRKILSLLYYQIQSFPVKHNLPELKDVYKRQMLSFF